MLEEWLLVAELSNGGYLPSYYFVPGEQKEAIDTFLDSNPDLEVERFVGWRWGMGYELAVAYDLAGNILHKYI